MNSRDYRETSYHYEEWEEFPEFLWYFDAEYLMLDVNFVDIKVLSKDAHNQRKRGKQIQEHNSYNLLDVIHDWVIFLKDQHGILIKPMKLNRTLNETKQMEEFINQISEHQISPAGPDIRDVRGENPIKWFHNSLFIIYLDHYLLSSSYDDACNPPIEKIEMFLRFCLTKYLTQSDYWIDGLMDKIDSMLTNELTTDEICQNALHLFNIHSEDLS